MILLAVVVFVFVAANAVLVDRQSSHPGLAARWSTRQLIIPQYDRVFVPSFWMQIAGWRLLVLGALNTIPLAGDCPLSVVLPLVIGLTWNPKYEYWSLTAPVAYALRPEPQRRGN